MKERFFLGLGQEGFHKIFYTQWGDVHNKQLLICMHGFTRNGREFDELALALSNKWRVLCPDMVGRGRSSWLINPSRYNQVQYLNDCVALLARSSATKIDWVGTSMGGLLGMVLASQSSTPIHRLVLNDIGPFVHRVALKRIKKYISEYPVFLDLTEAENYLRKANIFFGSISDSQWERIARFMTSEQHNGSYRLNYDLAIVKSLQVDSDVNLWPIWKAIRCPILVLRGEASDILTSETVEKMKEHNPRASIVEIPGCGHTPSLMDSNLVKLIHDFLSAN